MIDIRQTPEWATYLASTGWKVVKVSNNYVYIRKLPLFGSIIKIPRCRALLNLDEVDRIARIHKALFIKINPRINLDEKNANLAHQQLLRAGYQKDYWTLTIARTLVVDISKSKDDLLKSFDKDTRYEIRVAQKNRVKISLSDDVYSFYRLYQQTARRKGFRIVSFKDIKARFKAFKDANKAVLLFATTKNQNVIAGCMLLLNKADKEVVYHMAATSDTDRILKAPYLLVWQAMMLGKKLGYKRFDFEGIQDINYRATKNWGGFSLFKKGFRGQEVSYVGSYIKSYNPFFTFLLSSMTKTLNILPEAKQESWL